MSIAHVAQDEEIIDLDGDPDIESQVCDADRHVGAVPQVEVDERASTRPNQLNLCAGCGRPPGPVAALGTPAFNLGIAHCLNRLVLLLVDVAGCTPSEAQAIVLKLQSYDVEL